jgi:CHASE2 domain-containing sensor protein
MLHGEPLSDVPQLVDILLIVLLAGAPVAAALRWSTRVAVAVAGACAVILLGAAQLAFQGGWIMAVIVPLVALAAAALGIAVVASARSAVRRLSTT